MPGMDRFADMPVLLQDRLLKMLTENKSRERRRNRNMIEPNRWIETMRNSMKFC